jgi:hypothetical protein
MAQFQEQTCRTNITFSDRAFNAMQCNAMQCCLMQCNAMQYNTMQCNTMQCNAMQTVHMYGIQSNPALFFFFKNTKMTKSC